MFHAVGLLRPVGVRVERLGFLLLDTVTAMGYDLVITELDVRDNALPADITVRDRAVADYTRGYLDLMLASRPAPTMTENPLARPTSIG